MQFIVLIEFLVTGLGTALLTYALLGNAIPNPPPGLPNSDTANVLMILAISYPLGILVNFPLFLVQREIWTPKIHRRILKHYRGFEIDLRALAFRQMGLKGDSEKISDRELFNIFRASVYRMNIDRLAYSVSFYEGLERLSRGMLPPLVLAIVYISARSCFPWGLPVAALCVGLIASSLALLHHALSSEEEQIARHFALQMALAKDPAGGVNPNLHVAGK